MLIELLKTVGEPDGTLWTDIAGHGDTQTLAGVQAPLVTKQMSASEIGPFETFRDRLMGRIEEAAPSHIITGKDQATTVAMDATPKFGTFG
ncbi:MAG: hypothetical protein HOB82_03480 [Alphaproteobacteria bacterium]|jgi:hypothetical protein|nr:hypothetical protein [Alphaproteobacteria bacterium]MBT4710572.1 hypothetical protein [Alphaproteobacteria bacterium]MBT5860754.1 hypothetical protein [Alphaproteobacteria bacterium]